MTKLETEIIKHLRDGLTRKQIATETTATVATVTKYIKELKLRHNCKTDKELINATKDII